jgi:hypothetical protein
MLIVKRILLVLLVLIIIALIAALFISKDMNVEKEVVIKKNKDVVFNYIKLIKNQNEYSVWNKMDTAMQQNFTGTDGTVGFVSSWEGNSKVGKGSQTITAVKEGERVETELHFLKPWDSKAQAYFTTTAIDSTTTKVVWGMKSKMPYPFNLMKLFMNMEKMLGDDYAKGLASLKEVLEKK